MADSPTTKPSAVLQTIRPSTTVLLPPSNTEETSVVVDRLAEQTADTRRGDRDAYEILAPLAKGGMGEIFVARQRSLGREVAIKQASSLAPRVVEYFLSEARVTARLGHANIVPVHTLGWSDDQRPILAMKLVQGSSWSELLGRTPHLDDLEQHLRIFLGVCNAVAFAHEAGFLHRDLKPANVMVGSHGQVFVVDWGIAVGLDREVCDSQGIMHVADVRERAGTPAYMAPELARGDGASQGPATDVYLLGACLVEIVTGNPPHLASTMKATIEHALAGEVPVLPDQVPRELAELCRKALAVEPGDRFETVAAMRAAVEEFLRHAAARTVTAKGLDAVVNLEHATDAFRAALPENKPTLSAKVHRLYQEARFAFDLARETWPEDPDALEGSQKADRSMLVHALYAKDVDLAARLAPTVADAELTKRLEVLRSHAAAREIELSNLREQASMLDERRASVPVSRVFMVAGVLGGLATFPTLDLLRREDSLKLWGLWGLVAIIAGVYAVIMLRGRRSIVSPRIGVTWAAVGIASLLAGVIAVSQHELPFSNVSYVALFIGIGFVSQAVQTRRWLLVPAIILFVGAIAMAASSRRVEIFGALWFVTLTGVGFGLRYGKAEALSSSPPPTGR